MSQQLIIIILYIISLNNEEGLRTNWLKYVRETTKNEIIMKQRTIISLHVNVQLLVLQEDERRKEKNKTMYTY